MSFNEDQPRDEMGRWTSGGGASIGNAAQKTWEATTNHDELTALEERAASAYTAGGDVINSMIREDRGQELTVQDRDTIAGMDAMIRSAQPTAEDTVLYRGVNPSPDTFLTTQGMGGVAPPDFGSMKAGDEFTDKGFISTTTDPEIGERFATQSGTQLEIHAPAGTQGLSIAAARGADVLGESETVLPRGTVFSVLEPTDPMTGIMKVTIVAGGA
jgi:hypothetical protein